ncbi:hypothetical protein AYY16_11445 [Morganella psychrotolerans]|nr:hypothetical protein AYY16_11445 [Morganella psychrotolerans]
MHLKTEKLIYWVFITILWVIAMFSMGIFAFFIGRVYVWLFMNSEFTFPLEYVSESGRLALIIGPVLGGASWFTRYWRKR